MAIAGIIIIIIGIVLLVKGMKKYPITQVKQAKPIT